MWMDDVADIGVEFLPVAPSLPVDDENHLLVPAVACRLLAVLACKTLDDPVARIAVLHLDEVGNGSGRCHTNVCERAVATEEELLVYANLTRGNMLVRQALKPTEVATCLLEEKTQLGKLLAVACLVHVRRVRIRQQATRRYGVTGGSPSRRRPPLHAPGDLLDR